MSECPVCLRANPQSYVSIAPWHYVRCTDCAFVFLDPMPSQAELNALYQRPVSDAEDYPKAASRWRRAVFRALRLWPHLRGKTAIDVGCGGGFMTGACQLLGATASGLDIDGCAIAYAKKRFPKSEFHLSSFDDFQPREGYDFVYSSELIEHVAKLDVYMELIRRLTRLRGKVLITTPDIASPLVPQDIKDWDVFGPPYHVQFFSEENLTRLFARYQFTALKRLPDKKAGLKVLFQRDT